MELNFKNYYLTNYLKMMVSFSAAILLYVWFVEYILHYPPCKLCIYQRIPYIIIFIISTISLFAKSFRLLATRINIIAIIASALLSSYHFGVENDIFHSPFYCDNNLGDIEVKTLEEIKDHIYNTQEVSCKAPTFTIFGFSMAFWNMIVSIILLIFNIKIYGKNISKFTRKKS